MLTSIIVDEIMLMLSQAMRLPDETAIAIVGAGGKTSALFQLALELSPVIAATTTHMGDWQVPLAESHFVCADCQSMPEIRFPMNAGTTLVTGKLDPRTNRFGGLSEPQVLRLREMARGRGVPLIIEADGSRQRPLKAPAEHEPAIPAGIDLVLTVAGLSSLGKPLDRDYVHRPEIFARLSGQGIGEPVTAESVCRMLAHAEGGLKNVPPTARRLLLLNQADTEELQLHGKQMAESLLSAFQTVILASLRPAAANDARGSAEFRRPQVFAAHERVAAIILAAGASRRFGRPKQLLDYHGRPFVRAVAEAALAAGLSWVGVVTGANGEQVGAALEGMPVHRVHNADWEGGQGASIRAGMAELPAGIGAAVFLLADQPQVTAAVVRALAARHAQGLHPVVAPRVEGQRANPVLFDRIAFKDLRSLEGDTGGRAVLSRFVVADLDWPDRALRFDVDTPGDYQRLLESE